MRRLVLLLLFTATASAQNIPRTADGKPDFNGVWAGPAFSHKPGRGDTDSPAPTRFNPKLYADLFKPGAKEFFYQKWTGDLSHDDPQSLCLPVGFPRIILSPYSQQWVQTPDKIVVLYEYMHFFRVIPTDGRPHPKDLDMTWMGNSVAKWEGDTLVIDTVGLKEWPFAGDEPGLNEADGVKIVPYHSDALHVIERLRHIDATTVAYQITIDDPKVWTKPWSQDFQMKLHPTWNVFEMVCEENNRCEGGKCVGADVQKSSK
jgi:hypothetical protein